MKTRILIILLLMLNVFSSLKTDAKNMPNPEDDWHRKGIALIIGNATYEYGAALKHPTSDAAIIANALESDGYTVILVNNLALDSLRTVVRDFAERTNKGSYRSCLLYYAGFGFQIGSTQYLVPVDANPTNETDVKRTCLSLNEILREINNPRISKLLLMDTDRCNPFSRDGNSLGNYYSPIKNTQHLANSLIVNVTVPGRNVKDDNQFAEKFAEGVRSGECLMPLLRRISKELLKLDEGMLISPRGILLEELCFGDEKRRKNNRK